MKDKILKNMWERMVKDFMDVIVLFELQKEPLSGYDVMRLIHDRFNMLVSSGTVYSLLYSLERDGLIAGTWSEKRSRTYQLTDKGRETIQTFLSDPKINSFIQLLIGDIQNAEQ